MSKAVLPPLGPPAMARRFALAPEKMKPKPQKKEAKWQKLRKGKPARSAKI